MINTNYSTQYQNNNLKFGTMIKVNIKGSTIEEKTNNVINFLNYANSKDNPICQKIMKVIPDYSPGHVEVYAKETVLHTLIDNLKAFFSGIISDDSNIYFATGDSAKDFRKAGNLIDKAENIGKALIKEKNEQQASDLYRSNLYNLNKYKKGNEILNIVQDEKGNYTVDFSSADEVAKKIGKITKVDVNITDKILIKQNAIIQSIVKSISGKKSNMNDAIRKIDPNYDGKNIFHFSLSKEISNNIDPTAITGDTYIATGALTNTMEKIVEKADIIDDELRSQGKFPNYTTYCLGKIAEFANKQQSLVFEQVHGKWRAKKIDLPKSN